MRQIKRGVNKIKVALYVLGGKGGWALYYFMIWNDGVLKFKK